MGISRNRKHDNRNNNNNNRNNAVGLVSRWLVHLNHSGGRLTHTHTHHNLNFVFVVFYLLVTIGGFRMSNPIVVLAQAQDEPSCVASMTSIIFPEIALAATTSSTGDTSETRVYTVCPNTVIRIGEFLDLTGGEAGGGLFGGGSSTSDNGGGDFPLAIMNPNVVVQCGFNGHLNNNCTIVGGGNLVQIALIQEFQPFNIQGGRVDHTRIRGFHFKGMKPTTTVAASTATATATASATTNQSQPNTLSYGQAVVVTAPGKDIVIENCIFEDSQLLKVLYIGPTTDSGAGVGSGGAGGTGVVALGVPEPQTIDLTFRNCTFRNMEYDRYLFDNNSQNVTLEKCRIANISRIVLAGPDTNLDIETMVISSPVIQHQISKPTRDAGYLTIQDSCIINMTTYEALVRIEAFDDGSQTIAPASSRVTFNQVYASNLIQESTEDVLFCFDNGIDRNSTDTDGYCEIQYVIGRDCDPILDGIDRYNRFTATPILTECSSFLLPITNPPTTTAASLFCPPLDHTVVEEEEEEEEDRPPTTSPIILQEDDEEASSSSMSMSMSLRTSWRLWSWRQQLPSFDVVAVVVVTLLPLVQLFH